MDYSDWYPTSYSDRLDTLVKALQAGAHYPRSLEGGGPLEVKDWEEYQPLKDGRCRCPIMDLMSVGCKCGGK